MKKFSFNTLVEKVRLVTLRFPFTLFFVLGLAFYFFLKINNHHIEIHANTWAFFSVGIALSLAITLFLESYKNNLVRVVPNLLSIVLLLVYTFTLPEHFLPVHYYQLIILGLIFLLSAFFISFLRKNNDIPFWEFGKTSILQLIISFIFSQILMLGLSLAVLSLQELFKVNVKSEVYENLAVICYALFAAVYFLANIPDKAEKFKQEYTFNKFLILLGLYILLPLLAVYFLILYIYLVQIIIQWKLPNGWVSMLVSVLGLGGFLSMLILYPLRLENGNKLVNFLSRYFPLLLLPLLALMSVGIFRRLGDYGLTINRCYVLILNIWLYGICIYLFLSKSNHLKWIIISFTLVAFLSSVGPWSVFHVTERALVKEIGQLLTDTKLLKDGKIIDNSMKIIMIDSTKSKNLSEDIIYVCSNFGTNEIQPFFKDSIQNMEPWKINRRLGVDNSAVHELYASKNEDKEIRYFHAVQANNNQVVDIDKDFKLYIRIRSSNDIENVYKGKNLIIKYINNSFTISKPTDNKLTVVIPLKSKLKEIIKQDGKRTDFSVDQLTINDKNFMLIINDLNGLYCQKSDSITVTEIDADLFLK
jgi:hypothetical protein